MGCGGSLEKEHPSAKYVKDGGCDSNCDTEARELLANLSRKNSQAGETCSEPGSCAKGFSRKMTILKASLTEDINDDPNQFLKEIEASNPEIPERDKRRCREWVADCIAAGTPEPLDEDWREPRRKYRADVAAGIIKKMSMRPGSPSNRGLRNGQSIRMKRSGQYSPSSSGMRSPGSIRSNASKSRTEHPNAVPGSPGAGRSPSNSSVNKSAGGQSQPSQNGGGGTTEEPKSPTARQNTEMPMLEKSGEHNSADQQGGEEGKQQQQQQGDANTALSSNQPDKQSDLDDRPVFSMGVDAESEEEGEEEEEEELEPGVAPTLDKLGASGLTVKKDNDAPSVAAVV